MNKTLLSLIIVCIVAVGGLLLLRALDDKEAATAYPDRAFAVENVDEIARLFIADRQGRSMQLVRRAGGAWYIGDSLEASPSVMTQVLNTLEKISVDHIPPAGTVATINEALKTSALKIEAFDASGKQLKSLLLGPATQDERNSYMLVEGQRQPYAVRVPGFTGSLRPLFDLRSQDAWRTRDFVIMDPDSIASVRIDYPLQPGQGFVVDRTAAGLTVAPANELVPRKTDGYNERLAQAYLEGFAYVPLFARNEDVALRDSLLNSAPHARIDVELTNGQNTTLRLYPRYLFDDYGRPRTKQPVASYFVDREGQELARVQTQQLQQWLRGYDSFFQ